MLAVLQLQNINAHNSSENQVQGTATFTQSESEKDSLKNVQINIFAKGQLAPELPNYSNGIATGYLRFARLENSEGSKFTKVTLVIENFAPTTVPENIANNPKTILGSGFVEVDSSNDEIPF